MEKKYLNTGQVFERQITISENEFKQITQNVIDKVTLDLAKESKVTAKMFAKAACVFSGRLQYRLFHSDK